MIFEPLAEARAATVRVALGRPDGHLGGLGDLLERVAQRILQQDDLRLLRRDAGERVAEVATQLRDACGASRIVGGGQMLAQRLVAPRLAPLDGVEAGVDDEAMEPGRELRAAGELPQPDAHLGEGFLRRVVGVLGIAQDPQRQPLDGRPVTREQCIERPHVSVLRTPNEDRIAQLLVTRCRRLTKLERDRAAATHGGSLDLVSDLAPEALLPLLRGRFGTPYRFVVECASTQRLLEPDDPEGAVIATDHQTEGRGRLGRSWEDAPGRALLFSLQLRPPQPMVRWPELSLVAGEAVAHALRSLGIAASLRHPNDVVVAGRKLVGVLPEARDGRVVLGVGVNVNQTAEELPAGAAKPPTSLRIELGHHVDRARLLAALLAELEDGYAAWCKPHNGG